MKIEKHEKFNRLLTICFVFFLLLFNGYIMKAQGEHAPEAASFEPVSATDMVNLSSGDMAYVLPLLEIDGFPVTLSYHAGIPVDMDASWLGLGWNINTGSIARGVVSTPDDWSQGKSLNFTYYRYDQTTYTVNVGVGYGKAAAVGVGLSWGPNKSLSGSVSASIGPLSASMDTSGNYSLGVSVSKSTLVKGLGFKDAFAKPTGDGESSLFGGSLSISGNVNKGGISVNIGAGGSSKALNYSAGISISGNGFSGSGSIGGGNNKGNEGASASGGGSIGSFSAGDMSISSKGFYIPISIGIFNFGFGYNKQTIRYAKGLNRYGYGSFYHNKFSLYNNNLGELNTEGDNFGTDNVFTDYQRRNFYGDIYDQTLPQSEVDFVSDYSSAIEKANFTFVGYDSYNVNASGISGSLKPIIGQNSVLIGEGYEGNDSDDSDKKMKVFYHNSNESTIINAPFLTSRVVMRPTLNTTKGISNTGNSKLFFAFDGQITNNITVTGNAKNASQGSNLSITDFVNRGNSHLSRPISGSFVEVYTNKQLDENRSLMLYPSSVFNNNSPHTRENLGYMEDGIGGYKITTADGKVYHFAQPVYQYEKIEHYYVNLTGVDNPSALNSTSKRSATPYATHWLLTAITGPDFVDTNNNNYPDEEDYGYWLRLDHNQWSNAYTWRTPYANTSSDNIGGDNSITKEEEHRRYSTFSKDNINLTDGGHFLQGRKDLYYLDKIVSKNTIAYFVKDIRQDALGTDLDYDFRDGDAKQNSTLNGELIRFEEDNVYDTEYSLKLDKIIVQKRGAHPEISTTTGHNLGITTNEPRRNVKRYLDEGLFKLGLPTPTETHRLHRSENILDVRDFANYDYSKASKVIKFVHDYELAKESPNSNAAEKGKLTLKQVKILGRGVTDNATENELYDYMPPYTFSYNKPGQAYIRNDSPSSFEAPKDMSKKDSWGFVEGGSGEDTNAAAWSLNKIKTPQGSEIDINYEEDEFYVEAFSRRYWKNNLKFKIRPLNDTGDSNNPGDLIVEIYNDNDLDDVDFTKYFAEEDKVFFDIYLAVKDKLFYITSASHEISYGYLDISVNKYTIYDVGNNYLKLRIPTGNYHYEKGGRRPRETIRNLCFLKKDGGGVDCFSDYDYEASNIRGEPLSVRGNERKYRLQYNLLATKSPMGNSGGGLKVKSIIVNGDAGERYETSYDYTNPYTQHSSGITSFYPIYGTSFVPYQNELPGPGVMYEWVTMRAKGYDAAGNMLPTESTRYHFYTLQPNFDIFTPEFTMRDNDGQILFRASVEDKEVGAGVTAKEIKIEKNLTKIGQLISTEQFNSEEQLLNKTTNTYVVKDNSFFQETFSSLKSIYRYNFNGTTYSRSTLKNRLLSVSTKLEKNQVLNKVTSVTPYGISSIEYKNLDPYLGTYRTSINTMADGTKLKNTKYPAYENYAGMGSKIVDINNKNMLSQEAMNVTSIKKLGDNQWKTINANITTWSNDWQYRNKEGTEPNKALEEPIWRKHKNYVAKGNLDDDGTFGEEYTPNNFNWGISATENDNQSWQKTSEITRYTHYSLPIETKDINNNYVTTKMADNWSLNIASGNARYTEVHVSGVEFPELNGNQLVKTEGEFVFENCTVSTNAHTGDNSVTINANSKAFRIRGSVGGNHEDTSNDFRPDVYKISFWVQGPENIASSHAGIMINGDFKEFAIAEEIQKAGDWYLLNYYARLGFNGRRDVDIYIAGDNNIVHYIDDFRIAPVYASVNTYVYDKITDEVRYILDANNIATEYRYDRAGRLCRSYKEVVNAGANIGGFKLVQQYAYRYKNKNSNQVEDCNGCCDAPRPANNIAPVAVDDNYTYKNDIHDEIFLNVMNNDSDPDNSGSINIHTLNSLPSNGTAVIENNRIKYIPNSDFSGTDTLSYSIIDNGSPNEISNIATVTINIYKPLVVNFDQRSDSRNTYVDLICNITQGSGNYKVTWVNKMFSNSGNIPNEVFENIEEHDGDAIVSFEESLFYEPGCESLQCTVLDLETGDTASSLEIKTPCNQFNLPEGEDDRWQR